MKNLFKLFFLFPLGFLVTAGAQPSAELLKYQQLYKEADAVFLNNNRAVTVTLEKGNLEIMQHEYEELMLLGTNVNKYAESSVHYSGFIDLVELDAKTLVPDKNKYRTEAVKTIITEKSMDGSIFYDDAKSKRIFFSGLQPGARRVVSYKQEVKLPQLLPPFFFQSYAPCEKSSYSITVPNSVNIEYKLFNVADDKVRFTVEEGKEGKTYRWELNQVEGLLFLDTDAPNVRYFIPHIVVRLKDFSSDGKSKNVMASADDLYQWYYGFIKDINIEKSQHLQWLVDSLTKNSKTDKEKAAQIYYWVQDHIRYVAFEDGLQGFIPRQADSVCVKRYGDCKDMASILTSMMKQSGLTAYPAWVGTRDIPYTYEQVPSPLADNHMIAALKMDGQYYFLDATSKHLSLGFPSSFIQGKEALIAIDSEKYHIEKIPEVGYEKNATIDSFHLIIDNRVVKGTATKRLRGYDRQYFTYFLGNLEPDDFDEAMESRLGVGNNKFRLDTAWIVNRNDREKDLVVQSRFHIADYAQQVGDEIYINLNLEKLYYNDLIDTSIRKLDREEDFKWITRQYYELEIPAGYQAEYIPKAKSHRHDLFGFDFNYRQAGNRIILEHSFFVNYLLLKRENFSSWNKMIQELSKAYNEAIILKKKA